MRNLVIGMGEVGNSLFKVLMGYYPTEARDIDPIVIGHKIDVLHICIPYTEKFSVIVGNYLKLYNPELTIIYSSVPIGTSEKLAAVHSPIEGKHPALALSIQNFGRWLGSTDEKKLEAAGKLWERIVPIRKVPSADFTEWLKLRSTSKYGINIAWADYEAKVSKELGMDFSAVKQFDMDYNALYTKLGMHQFQRYVLDEPNGKIGGHCIVPNAEILDEQYPNPMLKMVKEMKS